MNGCSDVTQTVSVSSDGLLLSIPSPDALEYDNDMRCYSRFAVSAPQVASFSYDVMYTIYIILQSLESDSEVSPKHQMFTD